MRCEKCSYISFDYNLACPNCSKDMGPVRSKLGIFFGPPEVNMDDFFTGSPASSVAARTSQITSQPAGKQQEAELDLDSVGDEFEFTLDD